MSNTASESSPVGASIDQLAQEGSVRLLETIQKKCLFLRIRVHGFDGRRTIKDAQVEIDGEAIDKDLTSPPSCVLVPKEWRMRLGKIGRKVREAAQNVSITFDQGVYLVPISRAPQLFAIIRELRAQYANEASELAKVWPELVVGLEEKWGENWDNVARAVPTAASLARCFYIEAMAWPMAGSDKVGEGNPDLDAIADDLAEARAATDKAVASAIDNMLREPLAEFAAAVDNLLAVKQRDGTCRSGTLAAIQRAYEKLQGFRFMVPDALFARLQQAATAVQARTAQEFNSKDKVSRTLVDQLRSIRDEVQKAGTELSSVGQFNRMVRFD